MAPTGRGVLGRGLAEDAPTGPRGLDEARPQLRPAGPPAGPLAAFRSREYSMLYSGTMLTNGANWMQQIAQQWLLYTLTSSPFYLGLVGFARASPMLFFSLFGGVLADRADRRWILIIAQAFVAVVAIGMWAIVALGIVEPWEVLVAAFLTGGAMAIIGPARQSLVPCFVERDVLRSAIAINSAGQNATRVVGPSLAGVLIQVVGIAFCFLTQAVGMVLALVSSFQLHCPPVPKEQSRGSPLESLLDGLRYIRDTPAVAAQLWLATIPTIFAYNYLALLPVFARDILHGDSSTFGILMAASGAGAVCGALVVAIRGDQLANGPALVALAVAYDVLLALFAVSTWLPTSLLLLAICGCAGSALNSLNNTILQELVPDELRGRVMAAYMLTWGFMPLGALPAGAAAEFIGAPLTIILSNAICIGLLAWLTIKTPELRRSQN
jgi:MFS family permease